METAIYIVIGTMSFFILTGIPCKRHSSFTRYVYAHGDNYVAPLFGLDINYWTHIPLLGAPFIGFFADNPEYEQERWDGAYNETVEYLKDFYEQTFGKKAK